MSTATKLIEEINLWEPTPGSVLARTAEELRRLDRVNAELEQDAARYQAFFDTGLPVCFMGQEYASKSECDAAIDAALTSSGDHL